MNHTTELLMIGRGEEVDGEEGAGLPRPPGRASVVPTKPYLFHTFPGVFFFNSLKIEKRRLRYIM